MQLADVPDHRTAPVEAGKQTYKRPASVLVVVYTLRGEVLMLRRRRPSWFWQSVTGSLEWGETPGQAAVRELHEETGLSTQGQLIDAHHSACFPIVAPWRERYAPHAHINREYWFFLPLPGRRTIQLNPAEHREVRWLPLHQAARRATSWTNRDAILSLDWGIHLHF